jgi:YbbR domain-containing protein
MTRTSPVGEAILTLVRRIDLRRLVLGDWALKSAAIAVAFVLWVLAARGAPGADTTLAFDGRIPVERPDVPAGFVLRGSLGDVGVKLRGPEDLVRAVGQPQLRAILDLSGIQPGPEQQDAPVRVLVADERVHIVEVTPATVPVRFERRVERSLAAQARFANEPPSGFQAAPATFRPQQVTVSGPESAVAAVAAVIATVRFGDTPLDLAQDVRPIPVDAAGQGVDGVEVDPVSLHVTVPVQSTATTRPLPVLVQLTGAVATGYWVSRVTTDPLVVTVGGDRDTIAGLDHIDTAPVDVSGLTSGRTVAVALVLPKGVKVIGEAQASVGVTVVALAGTRPFPIVAVQVNGLATGLAATVAPGTIDVTLTGTVPVLAALGADAVAASVDVSGRGPGSYVLDVAVRAPGGTAIQFVQPVRVTVTIRSLSPSPTPAGSTTP